MEIGGHFKDGENSRIKRIRVLRQDVILDWEKAA